MNTVQQFTLLECMLKKVQGVQNTSISLLKTHEGIKKHVGPLTRNKHAMRGND